MFSSAFVPPAHFDLVPNTMLFDIDTTEVLCELLPELDIKHAHKAQSQSKDSLCGYYKIETKSGTLFFTKVKPSDRAPQETLAAEISTALFQHGACTLPLHTCPTELPDGKQIFVYPWVNSTFFDDSDAQIKSLGRELAILHNALNKLPTPRVERKNIIDIWKKQLDLVRCALFAPEYATNLRKAETILSRGNGCLAHNDLHRANVLFTSQGDVAAFIDFEDSIGINSSVLVDLSAVIERFCLLPEISAKRIALFLTNYLCFIDGEIDFQASDIVQIGLCRCFHALGILNSSPDHENPGWKIEVAKFEMLLKNWKNWEKFLLKIIP